MSEKIHIVIVGGGTAGWMFAAGLMAHHQGGRFHVTLVESEEIGTVGVGEATLPQMKDFNDYIGIVEADMMEKTRASFKLGIEFVDWGSEGNCYIHPFGTYGESMGGVEFHHQWKRARDAGLADAIERYSFPVQACRHNRFDFPAAGQKEISSTYLYAYHLDAGLYANYLRGLCEDRGLVRVEGMIVGVAQDVDSGNIASVTLRSGAVLEGDYFVDCTGFRALLIGKTLGVDFDDWSQWLVCDRAVTVASKPLSDMPPYTRSTAKAAGWQWRIPLQHRTGNGYVYSSQVVGDDEAATSLLETLGGDAATDPNFIRFQSGRRKAAWHKNCIAVGLSSGFLEPLESTSIYLIQVAITNFIKLFPAREPDQRLIDEFNRLNDIEYDRIKDFLILHYHLNVRNDSELWRYCRNMELPESLKDKIQFFTHRGYIERYDMGLFAHPSWLSVFLGQGLYPQRHDPFANGLSIDALKKKLGTLSSKISDRVATMPTHSQFIADYCSSAKG